MTRCFKHVSNLISVRDFCQSEGRCREFWKEGLGLRGFHLSEMSGGVSKVCFPAKPVGMQSVGDWPKQIVDLVVDEGPWLWIGG